MKKLIFVLALVLSLTTAKPVMAEDQTCVEVQVYGGGVGTVCGAKTHEPVNTDIAGITPAVIGGGFIGLSAVLAYFSKKFKRTNI